MKTFNRKTAGLVAIGSVLLSAGYVAGQQSDRLSIKLVSALVSRGDAGTAEYSRLIKEAANNPEQVSEVLSVAYSFNERPAYSTVVLQSLQAEQNGVLIQQNKRIIELLEQQAGKK